jgi:hypothetical protein
VTVELQPLAGAGDVLEVRADGRTLGLVRLTMSGSGARMEVELESGPLAERDLVDLVVMTVRRAKEQGATDIAFPGEGVLLRHAARQVGFGGGLRVPLEATVAEVASPALVTDPARVDRQERVEALVAALGDVNVSATGARPNRAFGKLVKRLIGGVGNTLELIIDRTPTRTFVISVPDRPDLMPEAVALAADMAISVLNRFPHQAPALKIIYFDRGVGELKGGRYAGVSEGSAPSVRLNVGFVVVAEQLKMMNKTPDKPRRLTSARPSPPFTVVDGVVAHELWHKIESVYEAHHYKSSIDFRRQLGLHLGVDTLEHAVKGGTKNAPVPWQAAHRRLIDEVSSYATTNRREATAELFKLWWCRTGPTSPVVTRFGELIDEFFPPSGGR